MKRVRFPIVVKRGSSQVKIYRDRKPGGHTYYRVAYHLGGKRHRLNFKDLGVARNEAEAKASQLSRGDIDAVQLYGKDRLVYGRALDAVKEFDLPLDGAAIEYSFSEEASRWRAATGCSASITFDFTVTELSANRLQTRSDEMIAAKTRKA